MATTVTAHDSFVRGATAHDGCVVERAALAAMIGGWVTRWQKDHPVSSAPTAARAKARARTRESSALAALSEKIGRSAHAPGESQVTQEMLNNIMRTGSPGRKAKVHVELRHADQIVTALGQTDAFHDGRLKIMPNPRARKPYRLRCCVGTGFQDGLAGRPPQQLPDLEMSACYRQGYQEASASLTGVVLPQPSTWL